MFDVICHAQSWQPAMIGSCSLQVPLQASFKHLPDNGGTQITAQACMQLPNKSLKSISGITCAN